MSNSKADREGSLPNTFSLLTNSWVVLTFVAVVSSFVLFAGLNGGSLANYDEAIYAEVAKEMLQSGNWSTLHYGGAPFFDKPPLVIWLVALTYYAFGISEFTSRIWPAIFGVGTTILVAYFGMHIYDKKTGLVAGTILLWNMNVRQDWPYPATFFSMSRALMLDVPLTFFSLLAIWASWESLNHPKYLVIIGIAAGLGALTKGVAIAPTVLVITIFLLANRKSGRPEYAKYALISVAAFLFISLPWHLFQVLLYGNEFLNAYLGYQAILRALTPIEGNSGDLLYYARDVVSAFGFWVIPSAFGFILLLKQFLSDREKTPLLILLWSAVPFILYTAAETKLLWYILPIYPAIAMLAGRTLAGFSRKPRGVALVGGILTIAGYLVYLRWGEGVFLYIYNYGALIAGALLVYLTSEALYARVHWRRLRLDRLIPFFLVLLIVFSGLRMFPAPDYQSDSKAVALFAKQIIPRTTLLIAYHIAPQSILFYSDHTHILWICEVQCNLSDLASALRNNPGSYVVTTAACSSLPQGNLTLVYQVGDTKLLRNAPGQGSLVDC